MKEIVKGSKVFITDAMKVYSTYLKWLDQNTYFIPNEALARFVYTRVPKPEEISKPFKVLQLCPHINDSKAMLAFVDNGKEAYIMETTGLTLVRESRRMTNRELSEYLATGKGQACISAGGVVTTNYAYDKGDDDEACDSKYIIRGWNETEWHEPLVYETEDVEVDAEVDAEEAQF